MRLSIIVPSFEEPFLNKTLHSLLDNSVEGMEIIPVIDGYEPKEPLPSDPRIAPIYLKENKGMRGAINAGLEAARGDFVAKADAHCAFALGFDGVLMKSCEENHLTIPRRYSLDEVSWGVNGLRRPRDYHFFTSPQAGEYGYGIFVGEWNSMDRRRKNYDIDDIMAFQGSFWIANRRYFMERVGFLDDREGTYGSFAGDQLELGLKYWLNGGEVKVNKNTWYAHLSKRRNHYLSGQFSRLHKKDEQVIRGNGWAASHWMNNREPGMKHSFSWLVEKFWPVPTWETNWKEIYGMH